MGDSAYAQSNVMMTPYPENQAQNDDSKNLFNVRHSAARMEMTECIYGKFQPLFIYDISKKHRHSGVLKKRFPYLVHMRIHLENAVKVIMCCAVLHNMTIEWKDEIGDIDQEDLVDDFVPPADHIDEYEVMFWERQTNRRTDKE